MVKTICGLLILCFSQVALAAPATAIKDDFYFEGEVDSTRVRFTGATLLDLYKDCMDYAMYSRIANFADEITIDGRSYKKIWSKWTPETVCAVASLNAKNDTTNETIAQGTVEKLPFRIQKHSKTNLKEVIDVLIPALTSSFEVDRVTLEGSEYSLIPGTYSADTVRALIIYNLKQARGTYTARGEVEGWIIKLPFFFVGNTSQEIQAQCLDYFEKVQGDLIKIREFRVNGRTFDRFAWNYWNPTDVCMQIYTLFPR